MLAIDRGTTGLLEAAGGERCATCEELAVRGAEILWCRECGFEVAVPDRYRRPREVAQAEPPF